ncbi:ATP-binding protein [Pyxidicoccus xibeiensis]|uniref:ATP-binding protein n=1 Tax=Pyxidicoccus xibeiensis TaxID=2906759 RepID=UPI0020A81998|nr:ATP-binding protein [Pyxidicoccus xibeiensis]MCP3143425.1 ATP-binding protein [Pyxidicoccus xibeiensis]
MSAAFDVRGVTSSRAAPAILLVEDSEADVLALQRVLQPLGVTLVCVTSGEAALDVLPRHEFVAVLLDLRLSGAWDGFETARRIREESRHHALPLLFITGGPADTLQVVHAYQAGAVDFLQKPLFPEQLKAKVTLFLELWHARTLEREDLRARELQALQRAEEERRRVDDLNATLVAQQEWLQSILRRLPVPLVLVEAETARILFANDKADEHWGGAFPRTASEAEYARDFTTTDLEGRPIPVSGLPAVRAARGETVTGFQFIGHTPLGKRVLLTDVAQVPPLGERAASAVVTFQDITHLKDIERTLREREREYRSLAESMPQVVWTARPDGTTDYINQVFAAYVGRTVEAALAVTWTDFIHPDDRPRASEQWAHCLRTGEPYDVEYRMRRADGQHRWFLVRALPMRDEQGRLLKWFGTATDVDDTRRASEASRFLAEASALLGNSLDTDTTLRQLARLAVPTLADWCAVDVLDGEGRFRRLAVAHSDPEKEQYVRDFVSRHPLRPEGRRGIAHVLRTGESDWMGHIPEEALVESTWGDMERPRLARELGVCAYITVALVARGRVLGALSLAQAESGRHFTEADVRLAEDLARRAALAVENARLYQASREAVRLRDEFISVASHELRTPLTPITLKVQALQRQAEAAPDGMLPAGRVMPVLDAVCTQTKRLTHLVDGLLDVSRISAGQLEVHLEPVDLASLLRDVATAFEAECAKAGCTVELKAPPEVMGHWDRARLEQVFGNLLSNALKYGAGRPIHMEATAAGPQAVITVRDEGIGISPDALPRLFGKFERAISERHYGGLGLGLYIARQLVEAHGGTIRVESHPGEGACFEVVLPLRPNR